MRVFLVEDDVDLAATIRRALKQGGYSVDWSANGAEADELLATEPFDALILDLSLPGLDGLEVLARLRRRGSRLPVVVLTARAALEDRLSGLDHGADDYLAKPFALTELEARLRAVLRRSQGLASSVLRHGRLELDLTARRVSVDGRPLEMPRRELGLLEILLTRAGRVVNKEQIAAQLFDFDDVAGPNAIEIYVHRLRKRLEGADITIRTIRGLGYLLEAP